MDDAISLITQEWTTDSFGQRHHTDVEREVMCNITGITRSEWNIATGRGFNPQIVAVMNVKNYMGEQTAKWREDYYSVYRIFYNGDNDNVELYLEKKIGVSHAEH